MLADRWVRPEDEGMRMTHRAIAELAAPPLSDAIDMGAFRAAPRMREPFDYLLAPQFLRPNALEAVRAVFPVSSHGGVEPARPRRSDDALGRLLAELRAPAVTDLFADKFGVALDPEALMITLRSRCRSEDGRIHTDSLSKVVTALIYLEPDWPHAGGRLRLLRGPSDLNDAVAEVEPTGGALLAFRRSDRSWHGHEPYEGVRRMIMLNWMVNPAAARREEARHALSAKVKRLFPGASRSPDETAKPPVLFAAGDIIRAALAEATEEDLPFTHWLAANVLPADLYAAIRDLHVGAPPPADSHGRRETHNACRLFFNPAAQARFAAADRIAEAFAEADTRETITALTGADLTGARLRIEYCLDTDGFWLEPHTDIAAKRFTMLIYLSDSPGSEAWGTDLLDSDGRLKARPPATPNSAVIFIPSEDSWHGFARRPIKGVRRTLIVNFVGPEWRATGELCLPPSLADRIAPPETLLS